MLAEMMEYGSQLEARKRHGLEFDPGEVCFCAMSREANLGDFDPFTVRQGRQQLGQAIRGNVFEGYRKKALAVWSRESQDNGFGLFFIQH